MNSSNPPGGLRSLRIKPTLDTRFYIDYAWWENQEMELRAYLLSFIPDERRTQFQDLQTDSKLDWIDPETAEVKQVDAFSQAFREATSPDTTTYAQMPLVDAIFKIFLLNGNTPLTPNELEPLVGRPAKTILRTIAGTHVYRGIRPYPDE